MALLNLIIIAKLRENIYFAAIKNRVTRADKGKLFDKREANVSMFKDDSSEYL